MRVVFFVHSLRSCWNHGNAHFLRGVASELVGAGHAVRVFEPAGAWSARNLVEESGAGGLDAFLEAYPELAGCAVEYDPERFDLDRALDGADLVLVHEWNDPALVARVGERRRRARFRLFFHDTHHRAATDPEAMKAYDLSEYDGVLAFGGAIRDLYLARGWARAAWTWHEAADIRRFRPLHSVPRRRDLVWIGNFGDDERTAELEEFLLGPIRSLGLQARVHGVRYPSPAREALARAGVEYGGWLPNHRAPRAFAEARMTVHVPRRPYAKALPGIPTIRPFEALACGVPLVSAPWDDCEGLFRPGDYLVARDGREMRRHLRDLLFDPAFAAEIASHGRETVLARHTCAHRVDELLAIASSRTDVKAFDPHPEEAHP